jgi:hypothetical protein
MTKEEFISGDKFWKIADFIYSADAKEDCNRLPNTFETCCLKSVSIVYTHTMYVKQLFDIIRPLNKKFIIITHNCDINVDNSFIVPDNVIHWFAQNVNVVDPRIESIPIGLENDRWYPALHKKDKMIIKLMQPRSYRNLVYMNYAVNTNLTERIRPYQLLENKAWVTTERGVNGYEFDNYIDNIYRHKYVICPQGNGMDTHRIWEALYMGSVPIVKQDTNNWFYNDMPILYVHKWEEVNREMLEEMWDTYHLGEWNNKKLIFSYWKNRIINYDK